jgi:hypothetical protein
MDAVTATVSTLEGTARPFVSIVPLTHLTDCPLFNAGESLQLQVIC